MSVLYLVATPIGNMEDMTLRAVKILKEVDMIACEDTRWSRKLFNRYEIKTPFTSFFVGNEKKKATRIIDMLKQGKDVALISDGGTPGISDPGSFLVSHATAAGFKVTCIPGPSAVTCALALSGFQSNGFVFLGFLPRKRSKKKKILESSLIAGLPLVFYESPHRIIDTLTMVKEEFSAVEVFLARELTKRYEEILHGDAEQIISRLGSPVRGEFVVILRNRRKTGSSEGMS